MEETCPMCYGDGVLEVSIAYNKRNSRCPLCKGSGVYRDKSVKFYAYESEDE